MVSAGHPFPDPFIDQPPRPARRILVSVRLFVALLAALGIGSVLWVAITAYLQHRATTEIQRLGGKVENEHLSAMDEAELIELGKAYKEQLERLQKSKGVA